MHYFTIASSWKSMQLPFKQIMQCYENLGQGCNPIVTMTHNWAQRQDMQTVKNASMHNPQVHTNYCYVHWPYASKLSKYVCTITPYTDKDTMEILQYISCTFLCAFWTVVRLLRCTQTTKVLGGMTFLPRSCRYGGSFQRKKDKYSHCIQQQLHIKP